MTEHEGHIPGAGPRSASAFERWLLPRSEPATVHGGAMKRGRPPLSEEIVALVRELRASGMGYGTIADKLSIGKTSVQRIAHGKPSRNSSEGKE